MPVTGSNSFVITEFLVVADSAPLLPSRKPLVSVIDAPAPTNCWNFVFSSTVMFAPPAVLPAWKLIGVCCCRPRVTLRPAASLVVVSQMFTDSFAACAAVGTTTPAMSASSPSTGAMPYRTALARRRPPGLFPSELTTGTRGTPSSVRRGHRASRNGQ